MTERKDKALTHSASDALEDFYDNVERLLSPITLPHITSGRCFREIRTGCISSELDAELHSAMRQLVTNVNELFFTSARDGHGGREAMIGALCLTQFILEEILVADPGLTVPLVATLGKLQTALGDLNDGRSHAALKPARRAQGRHPDRRQNEFRRRCIMMAFLSIECEDNDPYVYVFGAARETATLVGPFKRSAHPLKAARENHRGKLVFTPTTVRKWFEAHKTEANKAKAQGQPPPEDDCYAIISVMLMKVDDETCREIWLRSLAPENIDRSIWEIEQDVMTEFRIKIASN